jgi:hypothetical protein
VRHSSRARGGRGHGHSPRFPSQRGAAGPGPERNIRHFRHTVDLSELLHQLDKSLPFVTVPAGFQAQGGHLSEKALGAYKAATCLREVGCGLSAATAASAGIDSGATRSERKPRKERDEESAASRARPRDRRRSGPSSDLADEQDARAALPRRLGVFPRIDTLRPRSHQLWDRVQLFRRSKDDHQPVLRGVGEHRDENPGPVHDGPEWDVRQHRLGNACRSRRQRRLGTSWLRELS